MSGGSYDYVYMRHWIGCPGDLSGIPGILQNMVNDLKDSKPEVARAIHQYQSLLEARLNTISEEADAIMDLLQAVEWERSGDSGMERVDAALKAYREKNPDP